VTPTFPGVYIEEVPSGVHPITGVATSIAAFVDFFQRGPMNDVVEIFSVPDFERIFGGLDARSEGSYAIQQFFLNGGTHAWVVRVASAGGGGNTATKAAVKAARESSATDALTLTAINEGAWGNNLRIRVDWATSDPTTRFNLTIAEVLIRDGVIAPDTAAHELLRNRGYAMVRHFWRMDIRLERKHRRPTNPPSGIEIRTFVKGFDDHAVHAALEESFAEHWGWIARPFEEWAAHRLDDPQFDAQLWFVAEDLRSDRRDVAGVLVGGLDAEMGIVHTLGVRDRWRGRGVGRALLRRSFAAFAARGIKDVVLFVDAQNETGATRLYERVGMHTARRYDLFEKPLALPERRLGRREDERAR